jgi:hypothetical protein
MMIGKLHDQRGVAAMTVMLITAVLGTAGAVVLLTATTELESGSSDRRAEDAFAASEAGLDIAASHLVRSPTFAAGTTQLCLNNPLVDQANPCEPGNEEILITSPNGGQIQYPMEGRPFIEYTVVSRARRDDASRTLAATYRLEVQELPFGLFVDGNVDLNGTPALIRESMLVNGTITSRRHLNTDANGNGLFDDPDLGWRFHRTMLNSDPDPAMCMHPDGTQVGCAGAFSNFQIFERNTTRNSDEIHAVSGDPALSAFPIDRDVHQTRVDGAGVPLPVVTVPREPVLEVMDALRGVADSQGLLMNFKNGTNQNLVIQPSTLGTATRNFERNVVVYIDADAGDTINWNVNLIPGSTSSDIRRLNESGVRVGSDSGVIVVRGGTLRLQANTLWAGALFVPVGEVRLLGGTVCTCTIYAVGFTAQGGNSTVQLTPEWFQNLPAGFVSVTRQAFYECEPYQQSGVCPAS